MDNRCKRVFSNDNRKAGLLLDQGIEPAEKCPAPGKDNTSVYDIRSEFRRSIFESDFYGVQDDIYRFG